MLTRAPARRRLSHVGHDSGPTGAVARWLATLPPGTRGTAAELLPAFLTASSQPSAVRTPSRLGYVLARLKTPRTLRGGVAVWALAPAPVALPWH